MTFPRFAIKEKPLKKLKSIFGVVSICQTEAFLFSLFPLIGIPRIYEAQLKTRKFKSGTNVWFFKRERRAPRQVTASLFSCGEYGGPSGWGSMGSFRPVKANG